MFKINQINKEKLKTINKMVLILTTPFIIITSGCSNSNGLITDDLSYEAEHTDKLSEQINNENISMFFSDITDEDLLLLTPNTKYLKLKYCYFLNNLDDLPKICPNISVLEINHCPSVINLDFIYELHNLKSIKLDDCPAVNEELKDYLDSHNIENNITSEDIEASHKIDEIYNSIINDNMSDQEKIKAITLYMIDNFEYNEQYATESNLEPLITMTKTNEGVCAGYAYLANVLLCKAGINSHYITNSDHAWNIIEQDNKYYYLDTTNLDNDVYQNSIKLLNSAPFYMSSPSNTKLSLMTPYNAGANKVIIPKSLIEDIEKGESKKTLKEKYGGDFITYWLDRVIPILIVLGLGSGLLIFDNKKTIDRNKILKQEKEKRF